MPTAALGLTGGTPTFGAGEFNPDVLQRKAGSWYGCVRNPSDRLIWSSILQPYFWARCSC